MGFRYFDGEQFERFVADEKRKDAQFNSTLTLWMKKLRQKKRRVRVEKDAMDIDNYEDSSSRSSSESESEDSDIVIDV